MNHNNPNNNDIDDIDENDDIYESDDSNVSSNMEGSNTDPDALRTRSLHHNENLNFIQSIINELKAVLLLTEKAESGNLTEGESTLPGDFIGGGDD